MAIRNYDYISYEQYLNYSKNNKSEYINGEIYMMSPTHPIHNKVQNELYFHLRSNLKDCSKCDVYTSDIAVKFKNDNEVYQFEPDVMVVCDNKFDGAIYKGIPNLVIEVLSTATYDRDLGIKLKIYEQFGVNEYCVVDINKKTITVYSDNINGKYTTIKIYSDDMILPIENLQIKTNEIFNV